MLFSSLSALFAVASAVDVPNCGAGLAACPEEYPCCSSEGTCGNGYVCLGGCDPRYSNTPGACVPMPIFESTTYRFNEGNEITPYLDYWGDSAKQPWNYFGNITYENGNLRCLMYHNGPTTVVSSGDYLWYGKVTVRMKTSTGGGVVSDVILLGGTKDEIDYEMIGYNLHEVQTNYYWQGVLNYKNMLPGPVNGDTFNDFHDYSIDWQEDHIDWIIDGVTVRTLNKADTYNATSDSYDYPQSPMRVQFGLWPGGDSPAEGTSQWAGGPVDWNSADYQQNGYKFIEVESVDVQVYDPPAGANVTGSKSYVFTRSDGLADSVALTDDDHILGSSDGTGYRLNGTLTNTDDDESSSSVLAVSGEDETSTSSSVLAVSGEDETTTSSTEEEDEATTTSSSSAESSISDTSASASSSIETSEDVISTSSSPASSSSPTSSSSAARSSSSSSSSSSTRSSSASSATSSAPVNGAAQIFPGLAAVAAAILI